MRDVLLAGGLGEDGASARWCRLAVGVAASAGYAASMQALWTLAAPYGMPWWWWPAVCALVLLPIAISAFDGRSRTRLRIAAAPPAVMMTGLVAAGGATYLGPSRSSRCS